ncbi:MAG: hypothetical protein ACLPN6_28170 [Streptosporangiaceae bacterium]|jgi:hypothetical protein
MVRADDAGRPFRCEQLAEAGDGSAAAVQQQELISATITRPDLAGTRPGVRFGLIDQALAPLNGTLGLTHPGRLAQLRRDLAAVVSAEALFSLTDLAGLTPDEAVASLVRTATTVTEAALRSGPAAVARRPR